MWVGSRKGRGMGSWEGEVTVWRDVDFRSLGVGEGGLHKGMELGIWGVARIGRYYVWIMMLWVLCMVGFCCFFSLVCFYFF